VHNNAHERAHHHKSINLAKQVDFLNFFFSFKTLLLEASSKVIQKILLFFQFPNHVKIHLSSWTTQIQLEVEANSKS